MGFWQLMIKKDDWICAVVNSIIKIKSLFRLKDGRLLGQQRRQPPLGLGNDVFIILNGPSLKKQNLMLLKGKTLMFVNRGFKHELYRQLSPKYHVFIDPKMLSGEWPVTWIDEIVEMVPGITIIMPVTWASIPQFKPYIDKGITFHWLPIPPPCTCLGVAGSCIEFAIEQKFEQIFFTGFDANGIGYELIDSASHFYGTNEENLKKTTKNYVTDLFMFSRHLHDLNRLAVSCKKRNIKIFNFTEGGLLDMFTRKTLDEL